MVECTSTVQQLRPAGPLGEMVPMTGVCGHRYQIGHVAVTEHSPTCSCGTFAIGRCARCDRWICGDHSVLSYQHRLCGACVADDQQAAQRAVAEQRRLAKDQLAAKRTADARRRADLVAVTRTGRDLVGILADHPGWNHLSTIPALRKSYGVGRSRPFERYLSVSLRTERVNHRDGGSSDREIEGAILGSTGHVVTKRPNTNRGGFKVLRRFGPSDELPPEIVEKFIARADRP